MTDDLNDTLDHKGEEAHTGVVHPSLLEINMIELPDVLFLLCTPKGLMQQEQVLRGVIFSKIQSYFGGVHPCFSCLLDAFSRIYGHKNGVEGAFWNG